MSQKINLAFAAPVCNHLSSQKTDPSVDFSESGDDADQSTRALGVDRRGPDRNITTEAYMINALASGQPRAWWRWPLRPRALGWDGPRARGKVMLVTAILERLA